MKKSIHFIPKSVKSYVIALLILQFAIAGDSSEAAYQQIE